MKESEYISAFVADGQISDAGLEDGLPEEFGPTEVFYVSAGYSMLYKVRRYGRFHLLKALKPEYRGNEFYEQALLKEFQMGYQLEHLHICRTIGWECLDGLGHCILMEYVDGVTLQELMDSGRLTAGLAHRIVGELCDALAYLHSKQVLHRDLKPTNVMITHHGQHVKLIDFSLSDSSDYGVLKLPAGTPFYMAPEVQASAEDSKIQVDARCDIYSLGVMMGEMARITGDAVMKQTADRCSQPRPELRFDSIDEVVGQLSEGSQKNNSLSRTVIWLSVVSVVLIVLAVILLPRLAKGDNAVGQTEVQMGQGCVVLSPAVIDACRHEAEQTVERRMDTATAYARIQKVIDQDFPTEAQRRSNQYAVQKAAARSFLDHLLKTAP